ncbi:MAG: ABC transporter permease [Chitinophagales bacterium]
MKQFLTFIRKEFYHVFRDSKTLLMLFGIPVAQILLFGFALTNEIKNSKIVVVDYAKDAASQQLVEKIKASAYFDIQESLMSHEEIDEAFRSGHIKLAVVIPDNFSENLDHLHKAQLQVIADASDPNTATALTNYLSGIISEYQLQLLKTAQVPLRIMPEVRMLYNPQLKGATNFVPGVISLVMMLICVMMTAISIVREKELGTMEILLVSPFNPIMVVISKAVPYLFLSLVNLTTILLLSVFLLDLPINGSLLLLYAESTLFILTCLAIGLLISTKTDSQQAAMMISLMGMMLPTLLFTGFMFPIENMPVPLQIISNIVPSRWYYIIVKSVMIKGLGIQQIWRETLILFGMMLFFMGLSIKNFKIRMA